MSEGLIESGWAMLEAGNVNSAVRAAKQALQSDPNDFNALSLLTRASLASGDFLGASSTNEQLLRLRPDHLQGHLNRVHIPMYRGLYGASKEALDAFKVARPDAIYEYKNLLAFWEHQFGSPSKSIVILRELLAETPDNMELHKYLGLAEYEVRNPFRASEALSEVVQNSARDAKVLETLAFIRFRQFAFGDAKALADGSRRIDPSYKPVRWVRWGSMLALFPPFFVGHALQWGSAKAAEAFGPVAGHLTNLLWVVLCISSIVYAAQVNQMPPFLPIWQGIVVLVGLFAVAWALLVHYAIGEEWDGDPYRELTKPIKLDNY
jgi:tetratricopeptide (TPR) repeat protein